MSPYKLFDYLNGLCTEEEARVVEQWIVDHIDSQELDDLMMTVLSQCSDEMNRASLEAAMRKVMRRCRRSNRIAMMRKIRRFGAHAAAAAVVLMAVFGLFTLITDGVNLDSSKTETVKWVQVHAPKGESRPVMLPDSSLMVLKPGSFMVYDANNFVNHREVFLSGDLTAEVTHHPELPFLVRCDGATVQVLGTKFNVQSHTDDSRFEVVLYDGSVKVNSHFAERADSAMLKPGQILKIDKESGRSSVYTLEGLSNDPLFTDLFFVDDELGDIVNRLGRRFDMRILLRNPALDRQRFFAIYVNGESLDEILASLNSSKKMKITYTDSNTIEIR